MSNEIVLNDLSFHTLFICVLGCIIETAPPPPPPPPPFFPPLFPPPPPPPVPLGCETCEYFGGIGYVPDPKYCCKYYVVRYKILLQILCGKIQNIAANIMWLDTKYCCKYYVIR